MRRALNNFYQIHFLKGRGRSQTMWTISPWALNILNFIISTTICQAEKNILENNPSFTTRRRINHCLEKQEQTEESHWRRALGKFGKWVPPNCGEIAHFDLFDSLQSEIKLAHKPNGVQLKLLQLAAKLGCQTSETESYAASENSLPRNHSTSNILLNLSYGVQFADYLWSPGWNFFGELSELCVLKAANSIEINLKIVQIWLWGNFATVSFCSE